MRALRRPGDLHRRQPIQRPDSGLTCVTITALAVAMTLLAGCAVGPRYEAPLPIIAPVWQSPLPHGGTTVALTSWWSGWNDAALSALVDAAQKNSPALEQATARISQARATLAISGASILPAVNANASAMRSDAGTSVGGIGAATTFAGSVQALWELDLFGANQRGRQAAQARLDARTRDWHEARVALAAEVASTYVNLCVAQALATGYQRDATSRDETARLIGLKTSAGFEAPANAALARASAAEARTRVVAQRSEAALMVKALVALTGLGEADIVRLQQLQLSASAATASAYLPRPSTLTLIVPALPAAMLSQRPDLAALERELAALSEDIGVAEADRYPRITLSGSVGYSASRVAGMTLDGATWGFGPSLTLPVFDAGRRAANVDLAKARYSEIRASYQAVATRAVREVEEALTRLHSAAEREADVRTALTDYEAFSKAADARLRAGLGSVLELEDARRAVLAAQVAVLSLERERLQAWISLYRAVGGGWTKDMVNTTGLETAR